MINILINFIVFIIILFLYIHINYHLTTSNDLEIFEVDELNKDRLEEICYFKQPLLFKYFSQELEDNLKLSSLIKNYNGFDINIRNINDYSLDDNTFIPISLKDGYNLFIKDSSNSYMSEFNSDFINETTLYKKLISNDLFLRPHLCNNCNYDILMGNKGSYTPLKYELNYRNYIFVVDGEIEIMLTIPSNSKYLDIIEDYENFEFRSKYNSYNTDNKMNFEKIKFLTITLKKNDIIYIPYKWLYSIKINKKDTVICSFKYMVYMNTLAILPQLFYKFLQNKNIKHKFLNIIN